MVAFGPVRGCQEVEQPLISLSFEKKKKTLIVSLSFMGSFAEKRNGRGKKKKGSNIWFPFFFPFFFSFLVLPCGPEKKKKIGENFFFLLDCYYL